MDLPTVSVCMIVKDEEAVLARCLDSLRAIADEIVIADTGSTDATKKIALQYTSRVYDFRWEGDFAAARNFVFSKATGDYIYSADADEVLDEENRQKFLRLKKEISSEVELVLMQYGNQLQHNTTYNFDRENRPKLFKRLRTFRWMDPVHETVDLQVHILESDIVILHMPVRSHARRDFDIFRRAIAANGTLSARLHAMYARELFVSGTDRDFLEAYSYFETTLHEEGRSLDEIRAAQCVTARAARLKGEEPVFFKAALKNAIGEPSAEMCCELGEYYFQKTDWEESATWFYTAAFGASSELNIHSSGDGALTGLAKCYWKLGNAEEARLYEEKAKAWRPPLKS